MALTLAQKLRITPKMRLLTLHAPSGFSGSLAPLPAGVQVSTQGKEYAQAAREIYESLAYSHRKEYVEWIVTAKREKTRTERVKGTIGRLQKGWKNPRDL